MKTAKFFVTAVMLNTIALSIRAQAPDNGVPASEVKEWKEVWSPTTGSHWRTKTDVETGETVSFDPFRAEIWRNRTTGGAEAVLREEWVNDGIQEAQTKAAALLSGIESNNPQQVEESPLTKPTPAPKVAESREQPKAKKKNPSVAGRWNFGTGTLTLSSDGSASCDAGNGTWSYSNGSLKLNISLTEDGTTESYELFVSEDGKTFSGRGTWSGDGGGSSASGTKISNE